jgi:hypothetical protein
VRRVLRRRKGAVDQLDPVAVGVVHEADPVLVAVARCVGGTFGLDPLGREPLEQPIQILDEASRSRTRMQVWTYFGIGAAYRASSCRLQRRTREL